MSAQNNYDFILNAGQKPKKSLLPSGNSTLQRIAVIGGLAAVALIMIIVLVSLMHSSGEDKTVFLKTLRDQSEINRIATVGVTKATGPAAKNIAVSAAATTQSDQKILTDTLQKHGIKYKANQLQSKNAETDSRLETALAAATYDQTLLEILDEQLTAYQTDLQQAHDKTKSQSIQSALNFSYNNAKLLREQIEATSL
jgi:hypothetical protein